MTGLDTMQANFARSLLWRADDIPDDIGGPTTDNPIRRFNVYRNNVFASLTATLTARFPVIRRLVGEDFFAAMARTFISRHPPRSPVLIAYGAEMPTFLEAFAPVQHLPYLGDVARLELAISSAYHAADATLVPLTAFAKLTPEQMLDSRPVLSPGTSLLSSPYPIVSIWETNTHDRTVRSIGSGAGGESALIVRQGFDVVLVRLDAGAYAFLSSLAKAERIEVAVERAWAASTTFDLSATLCAIFRSGAISRIDRCETSNIIPLQPH